MNYRCIIFLSMLYVLLSIFDPILSHKPILIPMIPTHFVPAGLFIGVLWFSLSNIIAEVYGMKISIQLFWTAAVCNLLISLLCYVLISLPSPAFWYEKFGYEQHAYDLILGTLPYEVCYGTMTVLSGWYASIYYLTKWRILFSGRHFWLRNIGGCMIGHSFTLAILCLVKYLNLLNLSSNSTALIYNIYEFYVKIILIIPLTFLSILIIFIIRKIENINNKEENFSQSFQSVRKKIS